METNNNVTYSSEEEKQQSLIKIQEDISLCQYRIKLLYELLQSMERHIVEYSHSAQKSSKKDIDIAQMKIKCLDVKANILSLTGVQKRWIEASKLIIESKVK